MISCRGESRSDDWRYLFLYYSRDNAVHPEGICVLGKEEGEDKQTDVKKSSDLGSALCASLGVRAPLTEGIIYERNGRRENKTIGDREGPPYSVDRISEHCNLVSKTVPIQHGAGGRLGIGKKEPADIFETLLLGNNIL